MAFSQEVRFKIGGEVGSSLRASFSQATTMAEAAGKNIEKTFAKIDKIKSSGGLVDFRRKVAFEEASTVGKIKITTEKLAALSSRIAQSEAGTTKQKKLQLDFDKERTKLAILRRQQAADNLAGGGGGAAEEPAADKKGGRGSQILRSIGGAIAAGLQVALAYQRSRDEFAQSQEASRAAGLASTRARFAATGGITSQLRQGRGAEKDLENRKDFAQQRVNELKTPAQMALMAADQINPFGGKGFGVLREAESELENINAEIQKIHDTNALTQRDLEQQLATYEGQDDALSGVISKRREGRLNDVSSAQLEEKRLKDLLARDVAEKRLIEKDEKGETTLEYRKRELEVAGAESNTLAAQQSMRQRRLDVNHDLTGQAAEGRTFANGRQRPLSETERLARRAQQFRERARRGILTGAGGDSGRFIDAAIGDEASVAGRLSDASAGVKPKDVGDSSSIKPEIVRSNQLLEAIKNSLQPVDYQ